MSFLSIKNVTKTYGEGRKVTRALDGINLEIEEFEFVAVIGFSGSGKTTLVSLVAGLIEPDGGEITLRGKRVMGTGADRGVVFQNYSLLPWLTVRENVALAVDAMFPDWSAEKRRAHVEDWVGRVNLSAALHKRPRELSGGMRQRVAVARALATSPEILLLDEPFGALDALTRATLQDEIERLWRMDRKTMLLITNDVDEALLLADRVLTMTPGPGARIAHEYRITLERPRDRKALNHDPEYRRLRATITRDLLEMSPTRAAARKAAPQPVSESSPIETALVGSATS